MKCNISVKGSIMTVNFENLLGKLEKMPSLYLGKKLSPEEIKNIGCEHIKPFENRIFEPINATKLNKLLNKLDEIIAKNPKDVELRKYKAFVEKLGEIKK